MAFGPICFSIIGDKPSGPKAFEFLDFLMAASVCAGVKTTGGSFDLHFNLRSVLRRIFAGFLSECGVYCLLKLLAIDLASVVTLLSKLIP